MGIDCTYVSLTISAWYVEIWISPSINSRAPSVHNVHMTFPLRINSVSLPILFADVTSVTISSRNFEHFCSLSNSVLSYMIKTFATNNIVLSLDKTNIMEFITNN